MSVIATDDILHGGGVRLRPAAFLLDGKVRSGTVEPHATGWTFRDERGVVAQVAVEREPGGTRLRLVLLGRSTASPPERFGVRLRAEGATAYLRMGYQSWDGSGYRELPGEVEAPDDATSFALTQLVGNGGFLQLGFLRHDRFQHVFTPRRLASGPHHAGGLHHDSELHLDVEVLWDRRAPLAGSDYTAEPLLVTAGARAEPLLRGWAEHVAATGPAPRHTPPVTGWCSWYHLYASITEENLREHLAGVAEAARQDHLPMRVFQVDDGFTPEMGDWLEVRPQFPRGMAPLLAEIRSAGFTPGLWIAPFLVGNRSRLFAQHPDWLVVDRRTEGPLVCREFYGEFRWHKRSEEYYLLDTTHPQAMAYLREVFRVWREEWGCEYFKTDFMFYAAQHGPDRVRHHREGQTRAEIWTSAARTFREAIGDATWVGCGSPLWMPVGLVDGVRTGRDVGAGWDTGVPAPAHLENLAVRSFAHGVLWQADPDCILLRERYHHLTDTEVEALALAAAMTGGVMMTSDDLAALGPQRRALWSLALALAGGRCSFPLLGTALGRRLLVQVRSDAAAGLLHPPGPGWLVHVLNPGTDAVSAEVSFTELGTVPPGGPAPSVLTPVRGALRAAQATPDGVRIRLEPHASSLFRLGSPDPGRPARLATRLAAGAPEDLL